MHIQNLKNCFRTYAPLWKKWSAYKMNDLSPSDISLINLLRHKNFDVANNPKLFLSIDQESLICLTDKLTKNYPEFKIWAVTKFQFLIVKAAVKSGNTDNFLKTRISQLNISHESRNILKGFKTATLNELFAKYSERDFLNEKHFGLILAFHSSVNRGRTESTYFYGKRLPYYYGNFLLKIN